MKLGVFPRPRRNSMRKIPFVNNVTKAASVVLVLVSLASAQTRVELFPVGGPSGPILGRQQAVTGYECYEQSPNRLLSQQSCSLTEPPHRENPAVFRLSKFQTRR